MSEAKNGANRQYAVAPYNFVDFPEQWVARYASLDELPKHNQLDEKWLSGSLELEWEAVTPVIVAEEDKKSNNVKHFFRNHEGYAIPGNTIRGLIRSHIMILGMGNYRDDIQDSRFMYRDMASINTRLKEQYRASIGMLSHTKQARQQELRGLLPDRLKAGVVEKRGHDYYIRPAKSDGDGRQIFSVSEHKLRNMRLSHPGIRYMYKAETWDQYQPKQRIDRIYENNDYAPYFFKISFTLSHDRKTVHKIFVGDARNHPGAMDGWLLSSGFIGNKKRHYVILDEDADAPVQKIPSELVQSYEEDLIRKKFKGEQSWNKPASKKYEFYHLPDASGVKKPIFYVENPQTGDIAYFGFTPFLRIFYDHSVHDGIPEPFRDGQKLDYAASLFGFTNERYGQSYKSRLSFGDFQALGDPKPKEGYFLMPGEPKASAYTMYLHQPGDDANRDWISYNDPGFRVRGMKRYWLKEAVASMKSEDFKNEKMKVTIHPLPAGTRFRGTIRFHNLHGDELGLLLWAILLEPSSIVQVGMGKPYGFGQLRLIRESVRLDIDRLADKYGYRFTFRSQYASRENPEPYVEKYKAFMRESFGIDVTQQKHIRHFLEMTSPIFSVEETRYMMLKEFKTLPVLPTVEEFLGMPKEERIPKPQSIQKKGSAPSEKTESRLEPQAAADARTRKKGNGPEMGRIGEIKRTT
jgi:CRISPR-associated protein (TIGR03986 family)